MRILTLFALAMLAASWTALAAPVDENVTWLADQLQVNVADLPATVTATQTTILSGVLTESVVAIPLGEYAAEIRALAGTGTNAEKQFLGAGAVKSPQARGISWSGFAIGSIGSTPCIDVTADQTVADPGIGRGTIYVGVKGDSGRGFGVATMDVQVLPNPGPGTPVSTSVANGLVTVGRITESCFISWCGLRITTGSFSGDGIIYADGP